MKNGISKPIVDEQKRKNIILNDIITNLINLVLKHFDNKHCSYHQHRRNIGNLQKQK